MRALRAVLASLALTLFVLVVPVGMAGAQTTTTSSVPSLPVTGSGPTTTTTAPAGAVAAPSTTDDLATTGIDADVLFKMAIVLIALGAALQAGERSTRAREPRLTIG
ncbi:MAG: hypothetical protein ACR2H3_00825 [Acidimicrobiales bacterium]